MIKIVYEQDNGPVSHGIGWIKDNEFLEALNLLIDLTHTSIKELILIPKDILQNEYWNEVEKRVKLANYFIGLKESYSYEKALENDKLHYQ